MSDSYRPQGQGPHPTLAGNVLDPNISADGQMSGGQGVGATSEEHIREEGLEHIKRNTDGFGSGETTRSDNVYSGIGGGAGRDYDNSYTTGTSSTEQPGLMGTMKNYLGLGGESTAPTSSLPTQPSSGEYVDRSYGEGGAAALGAGIGAGATGSTLDKSYEEGRTTGSDGTSSHGRSYGGSYGEGGPAALGAGTAAGVSGREEADRAGSTIGTDPNENTAASRPKPTDSDVTTGSDPTTSADPTTADTAQKGGKQVSEAGEPSKATLQDEKHAATRENKDSIPTAGGEKLGSRHWGESKIVPDNPKPQSEAGVSSADGQPTDQTRDNTNANTGSRPHGDDHKEGMMGKVMSGLHLHGNKE